MDLPDGLLESILGVALLVVTVFYGIEIKDLHKRVTELEALDKERNLRNEAQLKRIRSGDI